MQNKIDAIINTNFLLQKSEEKKLSLKIVFKVVNKYKLNTDFTTFLFSIIHFPF